MVYECLNKNFIVGNLDFAWPLNFAETKLTVQKLKFSIKNFSSKCDQIRMKLRTWSHLLKKSLMENFIFCAVGDR